MSEHLTFVLDHPIYWCFKNKTDSYNSTYNACLIHPSYYYCELETHTCVNYFMVRHVNIFLISSKCLFYTARYIYKTRTMSKCLYNRGTLSRWVRCMHGNCQGDKKPSHYLCKRTQRSVHILPTCSLQMCCCYILRFLLTVSLEMWHLMRKWLVPGGLVRWNSWKYMMGGMSNFKEMSV